MKIKIKDLKQSEVILEIRRVNPVFVSRYRQAMRQGDKFPPLLIDQDNVIISGNHRYEAYLPEFGEDHDIEVDRKKYKSDAERIEDAIRDNARHGNPLDGISQKRAVLKLMELGRKEDEVARLLGVSVKRIIDMADHYVIIRGDGKRPTKRGLEHLAGTTVTKKQYQQHDTSDRAMHVAHQCRQLTRWLENGWVDLESESNVEALTALAEAIEKKLGVTV